MIKIGYYQFKPIFGEIERNKEKILTKLRGAEADLVVLPELPFTGYLFKDRRELFALAEEPERSTTVFNLTELCADKNMYVVCGFAEKSVDNIYNSALLIGPEGLIHIYRKMHLFYKEKEIFNQGNTHLNVQEIKGVKIGIMVCFDWIFPEVTRILSVMGADIICHPSNLVLSYCQQSMITRCLENNIFAITCNRYGTENRPHDSLRFTGKSQIVAPKGEILHRSKSQNDELYITEIDVVEARDKKMTSLNDLMTDRRPDYYRGITE